MEDCAIVALYWARDEAAIAASDEKYGRLCRQTSFRLLRSSEDAEECVNDTWGRAWASMPPSGPRLCGRFCCGSSGISPSTAGGPTGPGSGATAWGRWSWSWRTASPARPAPRAQWEQREIAAAVDRWLGTLPPADRTLFVGRYFLGRSVQELAGQLGFSPNRAAQRLRRLRLKLRAALETEGVIL